MVTIAGLSQANVHRFLSNYWTEEQLTILAAMINHNDSKCRYLVAIPMLYILYCFHDNQIKGKYAPYCFFLLSRDHYEVPKVSASLGFDCTEVVM